MRSFIVTAVFSGALMATGSLAALAQDAAELAVRESPELGQYVADGDGMSLYMFEADTRAEGDSEAVSACYDDCAGAWPPLIAEETKAGDQVGSDLIGTIERRDGAMQVTYGGWPLYYFVRDKAVGDTTGHDFEGFGAEWYLVSPSGEIVGH